MKCESLGDIVVLFYDIVTVGKETAYCAEVQKQFSFIL